MLDPAPQYRCDNLLRARRLAADAEFAGIQFVEAPVMAAPSGSHEDLRQRVLLLHLPQPVQTGGSDILVQGGVRVTDLPNIWAVPADALFSGVGLPSTVTSDQRTQILAVLPTTAAERAKTLVVLTRDRVWNGIDYLEVLDQELPTPSQGSTNPDLRQKVLLLHLFLPVPPDLAAGKLSQSLVIQGGVRITNVSTAWALSAATLIAGDFSQVPADEVAQLTIDAPFIVPLLQPLSADARRHILVIRTDVSGDFSPYELQVIDTGQPSKAPAGFDQQLSRVTFSFKVECPTEFDCVPENVCPPEITQAPIIDYLSKDYASFRALMFDRLAQIIPSWTERNTADIGVTVVEILAYAADQLSYFQDAVANEAYLGTAQRRPSLRRHARLLDYTPREGTNARTFVHFETDGNAAAEGAVLPIHTPLLTKTDDTGTVTNEADLDPALQAGGQVFETMDDLTLHTAHNELQLYTWGDLDCCLPKGATRATLLNPPTLPLIVDETGNGSDAGAIKPGGLLALVEKNSPNPASPPDPQHRQVVRLTKVENTTDPLFPDADGNPTAVVNIEWDATEALTFPLCVRTVKPDDVHDQPVSVVWGNIVLADHGRTLPFETLPTPPDPTIDPRRFQPRLASGPITFQGRVQNAAKDLVLFDEAAPAVAALSTDPRQATPAIALFPVSVFPSDGSLTCADPALATNPQKWAPVTDLLESGPFSQSFVVETENDGTATLRFGDDELGARPLETLAACYRVGLGAQGNIGNDALTHIVLRSNAAAGLATTVAHISRVLNVIPATGGTDAEPPEEIRQSAPQAFRVQERAVTEADYGEVAARHPGVQRAVASRRFTGSWYTMFVTVDRLGGLPVDEPFKDEFASFLEGFRLAGYDLEIEGAIVVPLKIKLTVCVLPGFFRFDVKNALRDTFSNRDLPDGRRGFFHPDNFTFGQPVFLSRIVAAALAVPGVGQVETGPGELLFQRLNQVPGLDATQGVLRMGRLEIAQLDNDPSQPEHGQIEFVMQGGS